MGQYVLVICETLSRYFVAVPLQTKSAEEVAHALYDRFLSLFGIPAVIHTDRGKEFENVLMRELTNLLGIKQTLTCAYNPQSNGIVERFNSTLADKLRSLTDQTHDWVSNLGTVCLSYNTTIHKTIEHTPAEVFFGWLPVLPAALATGNPPQPYPETPFALDKQLAMEQLFHETRAADDFHKTSSERREIFRNKTIPTFKAGDMVWYYKPELLHGHKLGQHWKGPFMVVKAISELAYLVQRKPNSMILTAVVSRLKPYLGPIKPWLTNTQKETLDAEKPAFAPSTKAQTHRYLLRPR